MMKSVKINAYGQSIDLFVHSFPELISKEITDHSQFFEKDVLDHIGRQKQVNGVILDVGANIGNHSVFFAKFLHPSKVIAFEPDSENYAVLQKNAENFNGLIETEKLAIGPLNSEVGLFYDDNSKTNRGMIRVGNVEELPIENRFAENIVDMVTLDSYCREAQLENITIIKIDVEGFELGVLEGALHTIERWKPLLYIEILSMEQFHIILNLLRKLGYACTASPDAQNPTFEFRYQWR